MPRVFHKTQASAHRQNFCVRFDVAKVAPVAAEKIALRNQRRAVKTARDRTDVSARHTNRVNKQKE